MAFASGPVAATDALAGDEVGRSYAAQVVALGGLLGVGAMLAYGSLRIPLICPLRLTTGVPCPLCGMTTGTTAFLRGDLRAAAAANPLSLLLVPSVVFALGDRIRRLRSGRPEVKVGPRGRRALLWTGAIVTVGSWMFQLLRFGLIG